MMCNTAAIQVNVGLGRRRPGRRAAGAWPTPSARRSSPASPTRRSPTACPAAGSRAGCGRGGRSTPPARPRCPPTARPVDALVGLRARRPASCSSGPTTTAACRSSSPCRSAQWLADGHELGWPDRRRPRLPPDHPLPAGAAQGLARAAHVRRPPDPVLAGRGGGHLRAAHHRDAADDVDRRHRRHRRPLGRRRPARPRPPRPGPLGPRRVRPRPPDPRAPPASTRELLDLVGAYDDRWVARGRSPADDRLDAWRRDGSLLPADAEPRRRHGAGGRR